TRCTGGYRLDRLARCAAITLACVLATGCAPPPPLLSPPLAPQTLGQSVTVRQQVTVRRGDQTRSMQVAMQVAPTQLTMIGLTAVGQRLFTLSWNGQQSTLDSRISSIDSLDPTRVLADLQLAYWPLDTLRAALPDNLRLEQFGSARMLWRNGKLLWFASSQGKDRWHSPLTLYNARLEYRLTIRPLTLG